MRVFAGPNGSGKSTIIDAVKKYREKRTSVDFGIYINADDIAKALRENRFTFKDYQLSVTNKDFRSVAILSGLVGGQFSKENFKSSYSFDENSITLKNSKSDEHLAQILADFIRKKLLQQKKKFSFETVFSHKSKLDIMKKAVEDGYKVYLYFVATEDPDINKFRVQARSKQGGHDVPLEKIAPRYYRSLDLLYDAAQLAYQAYFFDNSSDDKAEIKLIAHFKKERNKKKWDKIDQSSLPNWFIKYYSDKVINK